MLHLAYRELIHGRMRTLLSVLAVASTIALLLLFEGFLAGILDRLHRFPASLPADLVVLQKGVSNFSTTRSALRQMTRDEVEAVDGVTTAHPLVLLPLILTHGAHRVPVQLVVYETAGGPRSMASGRSVHAKHEIVLDARLARYMNAPLGTELDVFGYPFEVVGLSMESESPFAPYLFTNYDNLIDLYFHADLPMSPDSVSLLGALLVDLGPGVDRAAARSAIEQIVDDVDVFTPEQLGRQDSAMGERLMGPSLHLIIGIAWIIAWLTISMGTYANVLARLPQYATLKALGASRQALVVAVGATALVTTLMAIPLGLLLAGGLGEAVVAASAAWRPLPWEPDVVARASAAALVATVLGVLPALRRLERVDPDSVLRGVAT